MMAFALRRFFGGSKSKKAPSPKVTYGANFMSVSPDEASAAAAETSKKIQDLWNRVVYNSK